MHTKLFVWKNADNQFDGKLIIWFNSLQTGCFFDKPVVCLSGYNQLSNPIKESLLKLMNKKKKIFLFIFSRFVADAIRLCAEINCTNNRKGMAKRVNGFGIVIKKTQRRERKSGDWCGRIPKFNTLTRISDTTNELRYHSWYGI